MYKVAEHFISINGEGVKAGQLAVFVRFCGCNLSCSYCDTRWANLSDTPYTEMNAGQIAKMVLDTGVKNVTLTGGEPLLAENIHELIALLINQGNDVEIETNGSIEIEELLKNLEEGSVRSHLSFTMDYKLFCSGMESFMKLENFKHLRVNDTVKFVVGSKSDLERAEQIIRKYKLIGRCHIYLSPVFGAIEPEEIVEFMKERRLNDVNLQLQLHKLIWNPDKRGV